MMSRDSFDVVIAGAGLAGSSLALRLARNGMNVAVLDPGRFPRSKICGEFLSPECWGVFDDLGLSAAIEQLDYEPIHLVRISTPRGREVVANVAGPSDRPGIGLSRYALDDLILNQARSAGVTLFEGVRASGPIIEGGQVAGVQSGVGDQAWAIRARVTIAADGRQSALVRQTGTTWARSWFRPRLFGLKRHFDLGDRDHGEQPGTVGLHLIPGGYGGTCRIEGGRTNLCALLPESTIRARRGDLDCVSTECLGQNPALARLLAAAEPAGDWKTVAGVQVQVARPSLPGILYVGDSQGTVDPLGGQGMTMALLGSRELVPFVQAGMLVRGHGVDQALQANWQRAWHRRFDRRITLCRAFHHFLIRPGLTDLASHLGPIAARFLAACYGQTRDHRQDRALVEELR